ncbi:hypothetical protein CkaCkLH20_11232 [Colletotrichum karsti]|uniref:3'-5' exonuclease domain-containing protein n=1 Tax=Colletotrichum karsti TaxID=1095194 RepID=A0A9P6HZL5_9PEZI|nr:uncharacterized protein CkaCkLH20_11232 [Colletotrichum karsti]KAF9871311.1 hypothetical protein CkaCkLH20_11232 [Colletotrichum karsti]
MPSSNHLNGANTGEPKSYELVDTAAAVSKMIDAISVYTTTPPSLYIDLEGNNLCRLGTISILQIYLATNKYTYLVDVRALGSACFSTPGSHNMTLKDILEAKAIPKVFFDVRNDSDALFHHFKINLAGVQDLQLMEFATRKYKRKFISGLAKCIEKDSLMTEIELMEWKSVKEKGTSLFRPESGGGYHVFDERPLSKDILMYCIQDVQYLPRLWELYNQKLTPEWWERVRNGSQDRVRLSQSADYDPIGRDKAFGPEGWDE